MSASELFLVARIADRTVAIAAEAVGSVVDIDRIVPVPLAPAAIRGIAALRSRVVTVVDPALALGLPRLRNARRAVVTTIDGHAYAVLVDAVEDIATFDRLPLAGGVVPRGGWMRIAAGAIEREHEMLLVIEPARLVPALSAHAA